jgi:hypothetical protein
MKARRVSREAAKENTLLVGLTADGREVVINHPKLLTDESGNGYIVFSPDQARGLAALLNKYAAEADRGRYERSHREQVGAGS